jgi:3-oxoacyl-[acyl-carrier-protein] synthase III
MNIDGISFLPASRPMSNQDVVDEVRKNSAPIFDGDLDRALTYIHGMLDGTGLDSRFWFADDERPLDLMVKAARQAMDQAGCGPDDIDLLIYAGNCRGFIEPGDAYFVADALGMDTVDCFDVLDACMAWTRACDIAQSHFLSGRYKKALIVNAESYFEPGGLCYPSNFQLRSLRDIAHCFSAYCGGDGASATVLSADQDTRWEFNYLSTKKGMVDLCVVPLAGYERRSAPSKRMALNGLGAFTSFGSQVFSLGAQCMVDSIKLIEPHLDTFKMVFPHTGGALPVYTKWAEDAGFAHLLRFIYPQYGNLGAMSVPAAIALHKESGELQRGDKVGFWLSSSGLSVVVAAFHF